MVLTLFDQETLMSNHDASVERKGVAKGLAKGEAKGHQEMAELMAYLATSGRTDDIVRASTDVTYRGKLLTKYREMTAVK